MSSHVAASGRRQACVTIAARLEAELLAGFNRTGSEYLLLFQLWSIQVKMREY